MKTLAKLTLMIGLSLPIMAQAKTIGADTTKFTTKVKKTAKTVGNKTAEVAVKGESAVVDKIYKGKQGPDGQTIYINKHDHCYYVNGKGNKIFIKKSALHDKTTDD